MDRSVQDEEIAWGSNWVRDDGRRVRRCGKDHN